MSRDRVALLAAFVVALPVFVGAGYSMCAALGLLGAGAQGLTWTAVHAVIGSSDTWRSVAWTFATAGCATILSAIVACMLARGAARGRAAQFLAVLPLAVPHVAAALAAVLLLGQSGLLSRVAFAMGVIEAPSDFPPLVYDRAGIALVFAFAWKEIPYLTLTAVAVLAMEGRPLEEAARSLGATPAQAFWRITWPRLWRGLSPAVIAAFAYLVGQYEMPALLAPSDPLSLSLLTYERSVDPQLARRADAHVLALLALGFAIGLVVLHARRERTAS